MVKNKEGMKGEITKNDVDVEFYNQLSV